MESYGMTPIELVLSRLDAPAPDGNGFKALCKSHDDRNPSLRISETSDGTVLVKCWAGCSTDQVVESLGLTMADLFRKSDRHQHAPRPAQKPSKTSPVFVTADEALRDYERRMGPRAASWEYHGPDDQLVGIVARWNLPDGKKQIRPVSLNGTGWKQEGMAEPRPLYRLPELIRASGRVFVPEGEKCVEELRSLGLDATTSPHGAQSAGKADWSVLAGKPEIIVMPDNDDAGEQFMRDVVAQLWKLSPRPVVRVLRLPDLSKGGDIADWIAEHDAIEPEALREQIDAMADSAELIAEAPTNGESVDSVNSVYTPEEWPELIPLTQGTVAGFPIDAIPAVVRGYIQQLAEFTQTPVDLAAGMWMAATAICLQKRFVVQPARGWMEQLSLFFMGVMEPANRKSAVVSDIASPLRRWEAAELDRRGPAIRAAKSAAEVRIKQRARLVDDAAKAPHGNDREMLVRELQNLDEEISANPIPVEPRLLADDITPENLATKMSQNNGRMGVLTAEGDLFDIMSGRYSGNPNLGIFLKGHAGDEVRVDRGNRPSELIQSPALSLGFCVQPEVLRGLMEQKRFRGRGMLGRNLYSIPESTLGRRKITPAEVDAQARADYESLMRTLLEIQTPEDDRGEWTPRIIGLSPLATELFTQFRQRIESSLGEFGELGTISDWAGKLPGAVARIAGLFHVVEYAIALDIPDGISGDTMRSAIQIGEYFISHATTAFAIMGRDEATALAEHLMRTIQKNDWHVFTRQQLHQIVRRRVTTPDELDAPLKILTDHGFIRFDPLHRDGAGRKPSPRFEVHPRIPRNPF